MSSYFLSLAVASFAAALIPNVLYDVQMLQLSSYRTNRYWSWLGLQTFRVVHIEFLFALFPLLLGLILPFTITAVLWSVLYGVLFITGKQTVQKKKLVITARVKRILACHALLMVAVIYLLSDSYLILLAVLWLLGLFSPVVLLLSNLLTVPLEKAIALYYYQDARRLLAQYRELLLIGITGSYGKTSTKLILGQLLATRFDALVTPASYNTTLGVIIAIRTLLRPIHSVFVVEMGAREPGDIAEICQLVSPKFGIITAIGEQHLETFKDLSVITRTKLELFASLNADGIGFYNADDKILCTAKKSPVPRYVTFGIDSVHADYRAVELLSTAKGTEFTVITPQSESQRFNTQLLGRHNVYNILAAVAVCSELQIPLKDLSIPIAKLKPAPHRLEVRQTAGDVTILDNAFSSNPIGAKYALEVLAGLSGKRKLLITPGMVELGTREFELNREFGTQAAGVCDYVVLVGANRAVPIKEGLLAAGFPEQAIYIAEHLKDGQTHLETLLTAGDVLLYENDLPDNYNETLVQS